MVTEGGDTPGDLLAHQWVYQHLKPRQCGLIGEDDITQRAAI